MDPAQLRLKNFVKKEQFPYPSPLGFVYDSGRLSHGAPARAQDDRLRRLAQGAGEKRKRGELMGIGISTFTEVVGAVRASTSTSWASRCSIARRCASIRPARHRTRRNAPSRPRHETTWAQIVAEELGLDPQNLLVEEGDTDTAPYGLGTYASRSTPVAGAALAMAARRVRERGRKVAAHLLEASEADVEWKDYKFSVKGVPGKSVTMQEVAFAATPTRTGQRTGPRSNVLLRSA